ncbi:DUF5004 domain-containing protein [Maribellus sediminis]|uniref:DUF5004 domain-containing protein n=1 Tax=Maribellus sediminis TaxID=2696285 RepID=UPI001431B265|nr:DUF5004 domain-containing protein [Maribellus sediminis]
MDAPFLKKAIRLLLFSVFVITASCSKEESETPLAGDWEAISFTTSEPVDENGDGTSHTDLFEEMDCVMMEASFTSRGNFTTTSFDATYDIDIVDGEVILTPTGCTPIDENGKWSLNDTETTLFLEFNVPGKDDPTLVQVQVEISAQRLVLKDLWFSDDGSITYRVEFRKV